MAEPLYHVDEPGVECFCGRFPECRRNSRKGRAGRVEQQRRKWREHSRKRRWLRQQVFTKYGDRCHYCGAEATTIDHLTPPSRGGSRRSLENLRPACSRCNHLKANLTEAEYRNVLEPPTPESRRRR